MPFANPTRENDALVAWDGTAAFPREVAAGTSFGYLFEVITALAADVVIGFFAYDAQSGNACAADLATEVAEYDSPLCWMVGTPIVSPVAGQIVIPSGSPVGTKVSVALRDYSKKFSGIKILSGAGARIRATSLALNLTQGR